MKYNRLTIAYISHYCFTNYAKKMPEPTKPTQKKRGHRHLNPLEIVTISEAFQHGVKVAALAQEFNTSRQTIYNAIRTVKETTDAATGEHVSNVPPRTRQRSKRITPGVEQGIADMKRKYPT